MRIAIALLLLAPLLAGAENPPKLVLTLVVDQFRYDYLTRFEREYKFGLRKLLTEGAVYTNAFYDHVPTVTAIGHATVLSGATPAISGIIGNEWYDRETKKRVTSVSDDVTPTVGALKPKRGASPRRLLVSSIGDELKIARRGTPKVIGISFKDRSAVLPAGHMGDAAYWFDAESGRFISSTYYVNELPQWAAAFNSSGALGKYAGRVWSSGGKNTKPFLTLDKVPGRALSDGVRSTPFGNDFLVDFARAAIEGEKLGQRDATDLLILSFSSNDTIGHEMGPDSEEVRDVSIQTDRTLGVLFDYLEKRIGMRNVVVALTADHGVAPSPEVNVARRMPGGRIAESRVIKLIQDGLAARYGAGIWVEGSTGPLPYLNHALIREKKLPLEEVQEAAAEIVREIPRIARVYTATQVRTGRLPGDALDRRVANGYNQQRAADLFIIAEPFWIFADEDSKSTTHGSVYNYDAHVPVILMGAGIRAGKFHRNVTVNDIAPTLATLLDVETPSGSVGSVLVEALAAPAARASSQAVAPEGDSSVARGAARAK